MKSEYTVKTSISEAALADKQHPELKLTFFGGKSFFKKYEL